MTVWTSHFPTILMRITRLGGNKYQFVMAYMKALICRLGVCLLFYATATVFQLYHGSDMMCGIIRRKPSLYFYRFKGSLTAYTTGHLWCCKLFREGKWIAAQLNVMAVKGFILLSPRSPTQCHSQLSYIPTLSPYRVNRFAVSYVFILWAKVVDSWVKLAIMMGEICMVINH